MAASSYRLLPGPCRNARRGGGANQQQETQNGSLMSRVDQDFRRQLEGYSLATAEIFYRNIEIKEFEEDIPIEAFLDE